MGDSRRQDRPSALARPKNGQAGGQEIRNGQADPLNFGTIQLAFMTTPSGPCPYLPNRSERKVITALSTKSAQQFPTLNNAGFRRSHGVAYRPCCIGCDACKAVRILCGEFEPSRTQARTLKSGSSLQRSVQRCQSTKEHYQLFSDYITARHVDGDMALMGEDDFRSMIEETPVSSALIEWREPAGQLVGGCLVDVMPDGISMVYSYFDPASKRKSLGSYFILDCVELCRTHNLPHLYLGYWVDGAAKMDYKRQYHPLEIHSADGWSLLRKPE